MKRSSGFTLPELMVSSAIIGILLVGVARVTLMMQRLGIANQDTQSMQGDALVILTRICTKLQYAGAGLPVSEDPTTGQTALALPTNPLVNSSPNIIFLSQDNPPLGVLGAEDYWISYATGTSNGNLGVFENTYRSSNWLSIVSGAATLVQSDFIPARTNLSSISLSFIFYDGSSPPQIANQSPQATSAVRVSIQLQTKNASITREQTINLNTLMYGLH